MKARLFLVTCFAFVMLCLAPATSSAQFSLGGGLAYGTDVATLGFDIRGYYELNVSDAMLVIVPNFIWFLPTDENGADVNHLTFDVLLHWIFESTEGLEIYAIGGLGISSTSVEIGGFSDSETNINVDLGMGVEGGMDFGGIFGELRYVLGDANQLVLGAGVRVNLK